MARRLAAAALAELLAFFYQLRRPARQARGLLQSVRVS